MHNPHSSSADVQSQQALAETIARAVEQGFLRAMQAAPLKTRQVNVPATQHVTGEVNIQNLNPLVTAFKKLEMALMSNEADFSEMETLLKEIRKGIIEFKFPEHPEVQKVEVLNQVEFPKEIKSKVTALPLYVQEKLSELITAVKEKEMSVNTHVDAPDLTAFLRELSPLKESMDDLAGSLSSYLKSNDANLKTSHKGNSETAKLLSQVVEAINKIPVPVFRMPTDDTDRVKVVMFKQYQFSDKDEATSTKYYGYLKSDGGWYILRESGNTVRYAVGNTGYADAWTARASQDYGYFDAKF